MQLREVRHRKERMRRRARINEGAGDKIPGAKGMVPGRRVADSRVVTVEDRARDRRGVALENTQRPALGIDALGNHRRGRRKHVDGTDPVVVQEGSNVQGRNEGTHVLDIEGGFGGDAVRGQVLVNRGAKVGSVDEELEGHGLFETEELVYDGGEGVSS
ncbi:hypothetical protein KEM55_004154 [Ascosphaera atra]|nr:hypothetical protein KEM55_004154 [Ascosphaera atra]